MPLPVLKNTNSNASPVTVAAQVTIWTGNTNSTYNNNRNWTGSAPSDGDTVYIVNSSTDITGGNFQSTSLKEFRVGPSYTGNIGTSSAPLRVMAERLVIDNQRSSINIRGSFRDIHIVSANNEIKVGGSGNSKLDRLMVHANNSKYEMFDGQCNRLIVSGNNTKVTAPTGITNDNLLATVAGFDEIRCARGSVVASSSGVNDLKATGSVEIDGTANIFNARLLSGSRVRTRTSGNLTGRLTMFDGTFDVRDADTGDSFAVTNADLFGGRIYTLLAEQDLTFSNNASILGPVDFQLKAGSTVAVS